MFKSRILTFFVFVLTISNGNAQDIKGKWMQVKIPNTISYPPISIIEIKKDSLFSYSFNQFIEKGAIKILSNNSIALNDSISVSFRFIDDNSLEQTYPGQNEKEQPPIKFVRLLPTLDTDNLVNSLENKTYQISFNNEIVIFELGKRVHPDNSIIINNPSIATNYICIEKFRNTYFLCFYALKYRTYAFPIKEISTDSLVLYGIPNVENEVVAKRVN